jgi:hypothetical protein
VPPTGALIIKNNDREAYHDLSFFRVKGHSNNHDTWEALLALNNGGRTTAITAPLSMRIEKVDALTCHNACASENLSIGPDTPNVTVVWDGHKLVRQ